MTQEQQLALRAQDEAVWTPCQLDYELPITKKGQPFKVIHLEVSDREERQVMDFLMRAKDAGGTYQKHEILKMLWEQIGGHDIFESPRKASSLRKLQQVLHNLNEAGAPIVRHPKIGVWIASSVEEIEEYADWLEHKAKADIASMMTMRKRMLEIGGIERRSLFGFRISPIKK